MHWYTHAEFDAWRNFLSSLGVDLSIILYTVSSIVLGIYAVWYISTFIEFLRNGSPRPYGLLDRIEEFAWPKVGVVIPVYNDYEVLAALRRLEESGYPNLVVLVVDDSDDSRLSHDLSNMSLRSSLKVIHMKRKSRKGLKAGALNDGIDYLLSVEEVKYVLVLDADFEVKPGMIYKLVSLAIERNSDLVQGYQRHRKGSDTFLGTLYRSSMAGSIINMVGRHYMDLFPIFTGSCGLISRELLERVKFREGSLSEDWRLTIDASLELPDLSIIATHEAAADGAVPKSHRALWKQQIRWSAGTLSELVNTFRYMISARHISRTSKIGYILQGFFFTNGLWVYINTLSPFIAYKLAGISLGQIWPLGVYLWLLGIETIVSAGSIVEKYRYRDIILTAIYVVPMMYYLGLIHSIGTLKYLLTGRVNWEVTSKRGVYRDYYKD